MPCYSMYTNQLSSFIICVLTAKKIVQASRTSLKPYGSTSSNLSYQSGTSHRALLIGQVGLPHSSGSSGSGGGCHPSTQSPSLAIPSVVSPESCCFFPCQSILSLHPKTSPWKQTNIWSSLQRVCVFRMSILVCDQCTVVVLHTHKKTCLSENCLDNFPGLFHGNEC